MQGEETKRGMLRVGSERDLFHGTGACKGMAVKILIIIICFGFAEIRTTSSREFVTHREQSV